MSKHHFLTPSWTSGASATSNGAATADTDADKLLQVQTSRKFRSDSDTGIRITLDAGSAKPFDTVALIAHNGVSTDTVTITAHTSTTGLFTTPAFSFGPASAVFTGDLSAFIERDIIIPVGGTQTYRYIGIEINAASNPDNYFEAGVVIVGEDFEPDIGMEPGWNIGWNDPSEQQRSLNGEAVVRAKRKYRVGSGNFPKQVFTDAIRWLTINMVYGSSIPVLKWWEPPVSGYQQHFVEYSHLQWPSGGALQFVNKDGLFDVKVEAEGV